MAELFAEIGQYKDKNSKNNRIKAIPQYNMKRALHK